MIELYDVGRVLVGPFKEGYRFIAEHGDKYVKDAEALERIRTFHRDRSKVIDQVTFDALNHAWVDAIRNGDLTCNPKELVYSDVRPRFDKVRAEGNDIFLLTSGSVDLIELLLGDECEYEGMLVGEEMGDKNEAQAFVNVWEHTEGRVIAFYDDKPTVIDAAYEGFRIAGGEPQLYLVDRLNKVPEEKVKELLGKGVIKITNFDEI